MEQQEPMATGAARPTLTSEFTIALVIDSILLLIGSINLDGGILLCQIAAAVGGHIAGAAWIILRRRRLPARGDYAFVKWGVWPLLLIAAGVFQILRRRSGW